MADSTKNPGEPPPPPPPSTAAAAATTTTTKASSRHKTTSASNSRASPLSSHLQMIELKNRILTSLNKLSDRDTHQIAVDELDKISQTLTPDSIPMFLNCLYDAAESQQKPIVRKQSIKLLAGLSLFHPDSLSSHLPKIITHIVKRLKDPDSSVREACQSAVSVLAEQYLKDGEKNNGGLVVGLMVKPFLEALSEQNKTVQAGSAMCLARLVESASDPPILAFQKLCPRVCKFLGSPNFLAKAALLSLVSSLAQVGAMAPQSMQVLLQCIHECLESSDWSTRKAAAEALCQIASHSGHLIGDGGVSTITALEACRFDKVKPVRDSMNEALQLWKTVAGKEGDGNSEETKSVSHESKNPEMNEPLEQLEPQKSSPNARRSEAGIKDPSKTSNPVADSPSKVQSSTISDKTVGLLKKKPPILNDKELNPEFFQKLESRGPGDLPVEVVLPRRHLQSSQPQTEGSQAISDGTISGSNSITPHGDAPEITNTDRRVEGYDRGNVAEDGARDRWLEQRSFRGKERAMDYNDKIESIQRDLSSSRIGFSRGDGLTDNSMGKGNWLGIQRQLMQLERQQASIMNMLQEFMGGSHDSMVTLENRVRGLERVVEDMARDLALASNRRGSNLMLGFEGSSVRPLSKYNGYSDYASGKLSRNADGRIFSDRFPSDGNVLGARGRDLSWRSDATDTWDSYSCGSPRSTHLSSRRAVNGATNDGRLSRNDIDQVGSRRGWDKGPGPVRLGEGPSARSVWQASKDEATLEAIRVAGEDNGVSRTKSRTAVPDATGEALTSDNLGQEGGPFWTTWTRAISSLHAGDIDSAYADILTTGDDLLLVKLMDRSGPVMDQLSNKIAGKVLDAVVQFLQEPSLLDMGLSWTQQLVDLVMENGAEFLSISFESKKALLFSLHEASRMEPPDDWEGVPADELMMQLATIWEIELQQFKK
ncbi:Microtubule-associated protein [Nymphaea thermarum]|nr:Microtubule-associated protein [Nymphaea thermarum]